MKELWKSINNFEGYQISNFGNVKHGDKMLSPCNSGYNTQYLKVNLYNRNGLTQKSIHRLVAEAFIPNPDNKPEVSHKDANSKNNKVYNLEWATRKENMNNKITRQRISESKKGLPSWGKGISYTEKHRNSISKSLKGKYCGSKNPNAKPIIQLTIDGLFVKKYPCMKDAYEELNIRQTSMSRCLKNGRGMGYKWKFTNDIQLLGTLPVTGRLTA